MSCTHCCLAACNACNADRQAHALRVASVSACSVAASFSTSARLLISPFSCAAMRCICAPSCFPWTCALTCLAGACSKSYTAPQCSFMHVQLMSKPEARNQRGKAGQGSASCEWCVPNGQFVHLRCCPVRNAITASPAAVDPGRGRAGQIRRGRALAHPRNGERVAAAP